MSTFHTRQSVLVLVAAVALLSACQEAPGQPADQPADQEPSIDLQAEGEKLMQISREWSSIVGEGDLESALAYWAEDALMMPPGLPTLEGRGAIRGYIEAGMQLPGFSIRWEPVSVHVASGGDMAYMIERNLSTIDDADGNAVTTHGKVVTVWRKDAAGAWKNVVDMWNEAPPPAN